MRIRNRCLRSPVPSPNSLRIESLTSALLVAPGVSLIGARRSGVHASSTSAGRAKKGLTVTSSSKALRKRRIALPASTKDCMRTVVMATSSTIGFHLCVLVPGPLDSPLTFADNGMDVCDQNSKNHTCLCLPSKEAHNNYNLAASNVKI
jgi:hypothetical protein